MTKTSRTIIFFGNERLATGVTTDAPTLRGLIDARYNISAVVSHNEPGRSRSNRPLEIGNVVKTHNIPLLLPDKLNDVRDHLKGLGADIGVLVAYGKLVPQSIIDLFPYGIVNIHPSLLPLHRGPTPVESVILNNERRTGVSIMRLVKDMDAGPIFAQKEVALNGSETKQALANTLLHAGADLLLNSLPNIFNDTLVATPQNNDTATYDKLLNKNDGVLNWQLPARQLECQIRAYANWPKSRTKLGGIDVTITQASVINKLVNPGEIITENKVLLVGTIDGTLQIEKLVPSGKKEMSATAFLAGYKPLLEKHPS